MLKAIEVKDSCHFVIVPGALSAQGYSHWISTQKSICSIDHQSLVEFLSKMTVEAPTYLAEYLTILNYTNTNTIVDTAPTSFAAAGTPSISINCHRELTELNEVPSRCEKNRRRRFDKKEDDVNMGDS